MTRALVPTDYVSTRWLGFSVTFSWWAAFQAAIPNPSQHELLWYSGGSIDVWADPDNVAWAGTSGGSGALINPTAVRSGDPDRVIVNVSGLSASLHLPGGYSSNVEEWRGYLASTIANVRSKYPNVRMILLQPNIDGPGGGYTLVGNTSAADHSQDTDAAPYGVVRCTYTTKYIRTAIASLSLANVREGYAPLVSADAGFADWAGHITDPEAALVGPAVAAYYAAHL